MSHSFCAFIDESGDDGLDNFRDPGQIGGASHWLVISALIIRQSREFESVAWRDEIVQRTQIKRRFLHFVSLNHGQRIAAAEILSTKPIRIISALVYKPALEKNNFDQKNRLYNYATRYLIERISWLCRDLRPSVPEGDGRVKIVFSRRGGMSYPDFQTYLQTLKVSHSNHLADQPADHFADHLGIHWPVIDQDAVEAHDHSRLAALQLADIVASAFFAAVEYDRYGNCESRYSAILRPVVYRRGSRFMRYGIKLIPAIERCDICQKRAVFIELYT